MNITYELEKKDFLALAKYILRTNKYVQINLRNTTILCAILLPVGIISLDTWWYGQLRMDIMIVAAITAVVTYAICSVAFKIHYRDKFVRKSLEYRSASTPKIEMSINEDGIVSGDEMASVKISLKAIHTIEEDDHYIYFSILASDMVVIPKRAFDDEGHAREFLQIIKSRSAVASQTQSF